MASMNPESQTNSRYRWVMLALIWIIYFSFGLILSSTPPLVTPIANELALTGAQIGFILGTIMLAYIPLALPIGLLIDRIGTRKAIMAGITLVSLSGFLQSFATNLETLSLFIFIFGLGGPFISVGSPKVIALWFSGKQRGIASGIYITGAFVGMSTALAITNTLIMPLMGTWRNSLRFYGLLGFLMAFIWLLFGREAQTRNASAISVSLREAITKLLKERNVWIIAIIGFSVSFAYYGFGRWLPRTLELNGMSPTEAGFLSSIPGWCGLIGSLAVPSLAKANLRKSIIFIILLIQGICVFTIGVSIGLPLVASLIFYGISASATTPLLIVTVMDMPQVGAKYMGAASGILFMLAAVGGFTGPLIVGFLADLTKSIIPGLITMAVLVETMLVFTLLMKRER